MRYPINWLAGFGLVLTAAVVVSALLGFLMLLKWKRRVSWPKESRRRAELVPGTAIVESSLTVSENDDFCFVRLTLLVPRGGEETYRVASGQLRLRGIARLPAELMPRIEDGREIPIRAAPGAPHDLVIDLGALLGERAEAIEQRIYFDYGTPGWNPVEAAPR